MSKATPKAQTIAAPVGKSKTYEAHKPIILAKTPNSQPNAKRRPIESKMKAAQTEGTTRK